ncbi:tetratricopeptide repeat protein [Hansschlegelia plantiphila]|uniref:LicD family protein n=1 Tax=Hansschlegelia plantiphila TaxID=374655 RepID=A0A9W6MUE7_9HYPH|nr:hypothetical protein [Hansschlegelia plantiphila]GLK66746.1 hypothetical protein GCM10008179_03840 [Hansschlegelia plantiphila]
MRSLVKQVLKVAGFDSSRFATLADAGRADEAERLALDHIESGSRRGFYLRKLLEHYSSTGRHQAVIALFEKHAGDKSLATYPLQAILATALVETGDVARARPLLLSLILEHNFVVPLQLYRRLPSDAESVDMAVAAFTRSRRANVTKATQAINLVDIAIAANEIDRAYYMMMEILRWIGETHFTSAPKAKTFMKAAAGNAALVDLHDLLMPATPFFLISGTLLGVVREGKLLGADKDIDVGVMGHAQRDEIKRAITASAKFEEVFVPSVDLVKMKHKNGVKVDLFFHHHHGDTVWHGSHLHAWDNAVWWSEGGQPLSKIKFQNREFLIPSDPDRYLTDNYGDWRTPKADYDASLEAPNRRIRNRGLTRLHWQKLIVKYYTGGEFALLSKAFHFYEKEFGVDAFLKEAGRLFLLRTIEDQPARIVSHSEVVEMRARR